MVDDQSVFRACLYHDPRAFYVADYHEFLDHFLGCVSLFDEALDWPSLFVQFELHLTVFEDVEY